MTKEHIKEAISLRYIELIAAYNGFKTTSSFPDYGTDLSIIEVGYRNEKGHQRLRETGRELKLQLKATTVNSIIEENNIIKYDLETKNFNDIVERKDYAYPLILILFVLPNNNEEWINISDQELIVKKCAYWYFPNDNVEQTNNLSKKRIEIDKKNLVDYNTFNELINIL